MSASLTLASVVTSLALTLPLPSFPYDDPVTTLGPVQKTYHNLLILKSEESHL